jgi:hypothetical protein
VSTLPLATDASLSRSAAGASDASAMLAVGLPARRVTAGVGPPSLEGAATSESAVPVNAPMRTPVPVATVSSSPVTVPLLA